MIYYNMLRKWRITLSGIFAAPLFILILFSTSKWENIDMVSTCFFLIGAVLVGIATIGRIWCSMYITGYKTKTLITNGPYSMCRNPLYFFSLIGGLGIGLATETLTIPVLFLIGFAIYYPHVIKREQNWLTKQHGEEYQRYCDKTPYFIPLISLLYEPEEYVIRPRKFRRNLFDAMGFIWIIGILELVEGLHEANILPVFLTIY